MIYQWLLVKFQTLGMMTKTEKFGTMENWCNMLKKNMPKQIKMLTSLGLLDITNIHTLGIMIPIVI